MLIDSQEVLSTAQAFTAIGDTPSTNVIDTGAAHDEGVGGEPGYIIVNVATTVTSGGAATVAVVMQTAPDNATWRDELVSRPFALAALAARANLATWRFPVGMQRYWRIAYRVATAVLTAGAFNAFVVPDKQAQQYLPIGYAVG